MAQKRVIVIGAGIGGLVAALRLAVAGCAVTLVEAAATPGGKMREMVVDGHAMDAGPTVFTMRDVFEAIFAEAGETLADHITLHPARILARHGWQDGSRLDLFADRAESADAISAFAGAEAGRGYLAFCQQARKMYETLNPAFMRVAKPNPLQLVARAGVGAMLQTKPFSTLWGALGTYFQDPRLRQLFGRYATYCGSSPFSAPATLMLIAHVEQEGVWLIEGGMHQLAQALAKLVEAKGGTLRYSSPVSEILVSDGSACGVRLANGALLEADAVISNADTNAIATGRLGEAARKAVPATKPSARALSAITWTCVAQTEGFHLSRHTVFFSQNYKAEFERIVQQNRLPDDPTIYICAQDRDDAGTLATKGAERLLILINAPATGDLRPFSPQEIAACERNTFTALARHGLKVEASPQARQITAPQDFERMFPATGGALYGRATIGALSSFQRPGARSRFQRLYLAGGSVHPGAGVPMVALSGQMAAQAAMQDLGLIAP
jgi:1-hydroxycarotenoid 3,4-desaturase